MVEEDQYSVALASIWFLKIEWLVLTDLKIISFLLSQMLLMEYRKIIFQGMLR